ncbi:MAG TPA: hypothetical protein VLF94_00745 [Chlamydiales bacterium]|nr:hypothetical protein [Chlamydiales bacterium]
MAAVSRVRNQAGVTHEDELRDLRAAVDRDLRHITDLRFILGLAFEARRFKKAIPSPFQTSPRGAVGRDLSDITDLVFVRTLAEQVRAHKEAEPRWLESNYPLALRQVLKNHGMPVDKMRSLGQQEAVTLEQMQGMRAVKFETKPSGLQAIALHLQNRKGPTVDTVFVIHQRFAGQPDCWMGKSPDDRVESAYIGEHNKIAHEGREPDQYCATCPFPGTAWFNRYFLPVSTLGSRGRDVNFEAVLRPLLEGTDPLFKLVHGVTKKD